jgi:hypothetical protein
VDQQLIDLYDEIRSEANLRSRFITPRHTETNHVEFKGKKDRRVPDLEDNDRRNFSKALSAFSNANGGILIWGIRTRRKDGRDVASALAPIKQIQDMAERLRSSLLDVLEPQNPQVKIEAISNRLGNGYVKCLIPASDSPPHRAMLAEREYWARLDGRSVRLEHYMIRDMMLRHALPDLNFSAVTEPLESLPADQIKIKFRIINSGRAVAKYAGWFGTIQNGRIITAEGCIDASYMNHDRSTVSWNAIMGTVLHPNGLFNHGGSLVLQFVSTNIPIAIMVKVFCEGMTTKDLVFVFKYPPSKQPEWRLG